MQTRKVILILAVLAVLAVVTVLSFAQDTSAPSFTPEQLDKPGDQCIKIYCPQIAAVWFRTIRLRQQESTLATRL